MSCRAPLGKPELIGEIADGVALGNRQEIVLVARRMTAPIGNQPGPPLLVIRDRIPEDTVIGVLGDEALAGGIDHDTGQHGLRRVQGHDGKALVHAQRGGADANTHIDTHPLVAHIAPGHRAVVEFGGVIAHHLPVVDETPAGQHHTAVSPDGPCARPPLRPACR